MSDRVTQGHTRPFSRVSRSAELAEAVAATAGGSSNSSEAGSSPAVKKTIPYRRNVPAATVVKEEVPPPVVAQEYSLRVPKPNVKPITIMRFNGALGVDPSKWNGLKMAREDNSKLHKSTFVQEEDNQPKFGAGSEYGREAREEAKRKKYGGGSKKKYNAEDQPWIMKVSDKTNRKYRGVKEGGVSENASYYIFTQAPDGAFEVFPVDHWYNFTPIQRYKSLTSEEAEEQFGRRNKIYNYFSVMVRKRLKADEEDADGEKGSAGKPAKKKASSGLKVSEMDDWEDSDNEESEESDKEGKDKTPKKKKGGKPKKKKKGSDEEAEEDSDDGDGEGRELDYISDTSETESEEEKEKKNAVIGVDQETGLKNLLDSDSDEEDSQAKKDEVVDEEEEEEGGEKKEEEKKGETKEKKKSPKKKAKPAAATKTEPSVENLSDDDDDEFKSGDELNTAIESAKLDSGSSGNNSGNSRDGTPDVDASSSGAKRKATSDIISGIGNVSKKAKIELSPGLVQSAASEGITEEAVRRYLLRKPMTVTELLQKFKNKKTKIHSQDMVNVIAHILKRINPVKRTQNQKMYLYLTKS